MQAELVKSFYFEASHRNPAGGEAQARLHGHSYRIELVCRGEVDPKMGWLVDFGDIKKHFMPLYEQLDHYYLNDVPGLDDPTVAGIAAWVRDRLVPVLPCIADVRVSILGDCAFAPVEVPADPAAGLPGRMAFTFEATHCLTEVAEGHQCRRLHGHSYRIEAAAPDLQRLTPALEELYELLDHQYLNDVPGLSNVTSEYLSKFIWDRLSRSHGDLEAVVVQETVSARCIYYGG